MSENLQNENLDVIIIGGGPGGYSAAVRVSKLGGKVVLIEKNDLGGASIDEGTIPTKFLLKFAEELHNIQLARRVGISTTAVSFDNEALLDKRKTTSSKIRGGLKSIMRKNKVRVIKGVGKLLEPGIVEVVEEGERVMKLRGRNVIVASGSRPLRPSVPGVFGDNVITNIQALNLTQTPKSITIIGGGFEGVEWADIFHAMGTTVTILETFPQLLPGQDVEIGLELRRAFSSKGIKVFTNSSVNRIGDSDQGKQISFNTTGLSKTVNSEKILIASGRKSNLQNIGLQEVGLDISKEVVVDKHMMTEISGIYLVGDAAGKYFLTGTALMEGEIAAENVMGNPVVMDYKGIPTTVFTSPEVASVGINEDAAIELGFPIKVGKVPFRGNGKAITMGYYDGFVKIVADKNTDKILGVHIIGPGATEIINEASLAFKLDAKIGDLESLIHAHPTLSEMLREAALDTNDRAIHKI